jgi:hypothetical protein
MRFTPVIFAGVAAASIYWPEAETTSTTTPATSSTPAWPVKSDPVDGYWPKSSAVTTSTASVHKGWKTTTKYETDWWTVTVDGATKVWTSVKAIPTVWDEEDSWVIPTTSSTPAAPVKPTGTWADPPYCSAYTETCTVTVTATGSWGSPVSPVKPTTPVAAVYSSVGGSWPAGAAKPSGTG